MMRAKLQVNDVKQHADGGAEPRILSETVTMNPVCGNVPFGPDGESEDNTFARWTPGGEVKLNISNPNLFGKFKIGQKFYADFTEVIEQAAAPAPETAPVAEAAPEAAPAPASEATAEGTDAAQ